MSNAYDKLNQRLSEEKSGSAAPEPRGYITPGDGYVPGHNRLSAPQESQTQRSGRGVTPPHDSYDPHGKYHGHPLHHVYRRRIRGVRARWASSAFLLGLLTGGLLMLLASAAVVTQFPSVLSTFAGDPDVAVVISEDYLNRQATERLKSPYDTGVQNLKLTGANIDLKPGNRMDLNPRFTADVILTSLNINASVSNELTVKDGKLVITMVGNPKLGDLNVPLELLPFDLNDAARQAINNIDNDLLAAEINQEVASAVSGTQFEIQGITTTENGLTLRLQQR